MRVLEQPWARVKNPTPIPDNVDVVMLEAMGDEEFAVLLRDNLIPRTPEIRAAWDRLWDVLYDDDDLADRACDVLDDFADAARAFLQQGPDEAPMARAKKFLVNVEFSLSRLAVEDRVKLPTQVALRRLVYAITRHRALIKERGEPTEIDEQLWRALSRVGLDPAEQK